MPPRRPGGKYKGMIVRAKGEATLAEEARIAAQKKREELARKLAEKRQAALLMSHGMKSAQEQEEEAKKQRVMALLMGGKKGNTKKFFKAWVIGLRVVKNERLTGERKAAWQKGCNCHESHIGPCNIEYRLCATTFELPFTALQRTLGSMSGYGGGTSYDATWRSKSVPLLNSSTGRTIPPTRPLALAGGLPALPGTTPASQVPWPVPLGTSSPMPLGTSSQMPLGASSPSLRGTTQQMAPAAALSLQAPPPPEPFVDPENAEVVVHHRTGRQCFLDKFTMRVMFADEGKGTVM